MGQVSFTIEGEAASKANQRRLVHIKGRPALIKSDKARKFEKAASMQIPASARVMWAGPVGVVLKMFYASNRPDLDESIVLDVMQARFETVKQFDGKTTRFLNRRGVYLNDRQVKQKHVFHAIDRTRPRVEVVVWQLPNGPNNDDASDADDQP